LPGHARCGQNFAHWKGKQSRAGNRRQLRLKLSVAFEAVKIIPENAVSMCARTGALFSYRTEDVSGDALFVSKLRKKVALRRFALKQVLLFK
jgi:hypothetical protein